MEQETLKPDWPVNRFKEYREEVKVQLGNLWFISQDATKAIAGNLQLRYIAEKKVWFLFADTVEIGRFLLPFSEESLVRFQRLCSANYQSE